MKENLEFKQKCSLLSTGIFLIIFSRADINLLKIFHILMRSLENKECHDKERLQFE